MGQSQSGAAAGEIAASRVINRLELRRGQRPKSRAFTGQPPFAGQARRRLRAKADSLRAKADSLRARAD